MRIILFIALMVAMAFTMQAQNIIYVSPGGSGTGETANSPTNLQNALNAAKINNLADELRLQEGVYDGTSYYYDLTGSDNTDITIKGGWNATYTVQSTNISATKIDGLGVNRGLEINGSGAAKDIIVSIEYLTFSNCKIIDVNGGALNATGGANDEFDSKIHLNLDHIHFMNNQTVSSGSGGAIYTNCSFDINNCVFDGNEAANNGGAIFAAYLNINENLDRNIYRTTFLNNINRGNQGSSIWTNTTLKIENSSFYGVDDNGSSGNGSAVYGNNNADINIDRCEFEGITINYWGSAVQGFDADIEISNSKFTYNKSGVITGYGTVAFYHSNSDIDRELKITNCTFANNEGPITGIGGNAVNFRGDEGDQLKIYNSIFWKNGSVPLYAESGTAVIDYSISEYGTNGFTEGANFSFTTDPLLNAANNLSSNSPCIDAGSSAYIDPSWKDFFGDPRVVGAEVDMGHEEYQEVNTGITNLELANITLYPNPVVDKLHLELGEIGKKKYTIYNALGSKIDDEEFYGTTKEISVQDLAKGHYFIHIQHNGSEVSLPFVKQ
ncbi:MAG: T9SS type A sorting domain-containing protein [Chitinophagales bacterium]